MRDDLLFYYERELSFLRQMGGQFAEKYPKVAGRLLLEPGKCEDPHVERLLEAFAFLAARVHLKIDDEFPEIVEALFSILYPNYIRPIPSMSIAQFHLDPEQGKLTEGLRIPKGSQLHSAPVGGYRCKFHTCFDTTLWPVAVKAAQWTTPDQVRGRARNTGAAAVLRLELNCFPDVRFDKLTLDSLRFFLAGEGALTHALIELLSNNCIDIVARDPAAPAKKWVSLGPDAVRQVGFADEESVLPYPPRSFQGYRVLHEYFTFPEKFLFLDLTGWAKIAAAGFGEKLELIFEISPFERADRKQTLELGVSEKTFCLGCSPIVNLFQQTAEPILLEEKRYEYRIVPDARRETATDIFSVNEVLGGSPGAPAPIVYEPFYSYRHANTRDKKQAFWHVVRRPSTWRTDRGTDVYLTLVDLTGRKVVPDEDTITVRLTCSNRELPSRLPFGNEDGDFQLEGGGPITRIVSLVKPTDSVQPPARATHLWRLISQLSLNYLSLVDQGKDAFKEILQLHDFVDSTSVHRQIEGILNLRSRPHFATVISDYGISYVRGTRVEIEFDEEQFVGSGVYTFASVLEHFLALYVSMNSFSQLVARTRQRKGVLREWSPRSGQRILL